RTRARRHLPRRLPCDGQPVSAAPRRARLASGAGLHPCRPLPHVADPLSSIRLFGSQAPRRRLDRRRPVGGRHHRLVRRRRLPDPHETQPLPNPLSCYFPHLPKRLHRMEVLGNHFAQLVVPWFLFLPQPIATLAGIVIVATQSWLVVSGNFAWLNFVTIALAISAFDNAALGRVFPLTPYGPQSSPGWYLAIVLAATALIVLLSYRPARNLLSRRQIMNASFDPFHIVGTYGAFGSVTKERFEIVIEGTADPVLTSDT